MISDNDCMLWAGSTTSNGYAHVSIKNNKGKWSTGVLHRQLYLVLVGDIPEGYVLDHLCGNRLCINTDHLEPVTNAENLNRGNRPNVWGTHCNNGHLVTNDSYWITTKNRRICKKCRSNYQKARYAQIKQQRLMAI